MKVLIDNGHGAETPGKRSPDGRLLEWEFNRRLARAIAARLSAEGIENELIVPEESDISLAERCARANARCAGRADCVLLSIHANAAGTSGWHEASGWCAFAAPRASEASRRLAARLVAAAAARGLRGNRAVPPQGFWTASLAICRDTRCPAVLTENMFMDNRSDLDFLLSDGAVDILADLHAEVLKDYSRTL